MVKVMAVQKQIVTGWKYLAQMIVTGVFITGQ
jgi:hypothetical protein